jgi:hypothetical protein
MTDETDLPSVEESVGIWYELERALEGKNGYGGDVAEIYAYRLLPRGVAEIRELSWISSEAEAKSRAAEAEMARLAAKNLTLLVRRFVELHADVEIGIEIDPRQFRVIDPRVEALQPFLHRIHIRVTRATRIRRALASELRTLWDCLKDVHALLPEGFDFARWSLATKDLIAALDDETTATAVRAPEPPMEVEKLRAALREALAAIDKGCDMQYGDCIGPMSPARVDELRRLVP